MQKQVEKTRKFMQKHGLPLDQSLPNCWNSKNITTVIEATAEILLTRAKMLEDLMPNVVHDPRLMRTHLMVEELGEAVLGLAHCDEVETLDGLSDLAFVTIGTALAFDLPLTDGLNEVCDSNLTKKITDERMRDKGDDYVPPDMKRVLSWYRGIDVTAKRTSCVEGGQTYMTTVKIKRRYHKELQSWWIYVIGGVTGYESMREDDVKCHNYDGWFACAGTKNKWDELFLPAESMKKIQEWLEQ